MKLSTRSVPFLATRALCALLALPQLACTASSASTSRNASSEGAAPSSAPAHSKVDPAGHGAAAPAQAGSPAVDSAQKAVATRTAAEVLAAARASLGWDRLAASHGAVRVESAAKVLGTDATQTSVFDGAGRYVESTDGPLGQSNGSDGRISWSRDWSGTSHVLALGDLANAQISYLLSTGAWTSGSVMLRFEPDVRTVDGLLELRFAHADGVQRGSIRIDPATMRARSASHTSDAVASTWTFDGYEDHDGFVLPRAIESTRDGHTERAEVRKVVRLPRVDEAVFAPRLDPPHDVRFDASVASAIEVKRVPSGHLLVHPRIDGKDLGWFIFDTGAGTNCISNSVTKQLGTEPFGEIGAHGVGGTVAARFWRAKELQLGPLTIEGPLLMGLDLDFLEQHFGVPVGGILGYEFLSRCVAEIDTQKGEIAIHDPAQYALPEGGRWEELVPYGRHPCIRARFEDHEGVFRIDTGAGNDTVTLHYQVVADLGLAKGRETQSGNAGGVGGSVGTRTGTLASFRLGGRDFGAIPASFALDDKGAFSDDYIAGNIGGKLLEPFRMAFDYPGGRIGFVPRP